MLTLSASVCAWEGRTGERDRGKLSDLPAPSREVCEGVRSVKEVWGGLLRGKGAFLLRGCGVGLKSDQGREF